MSNGLTQTMAEMIAKARPQFQVSPRQRTVTTSGPIQSKETKVSGHIDPVGIMRGYRELTGWVDPETRRKQAGFMHEIFNLKRSEADTPEKQNELSELLSNPGLQKNMQSWAEAGYGGVVPTGRKDRQGKDTYDWIYGPPSTEALKTSAFAAMPPEAKQREVTRPYTETEIGAGLGPKGTRETAMQTAQQTAQQARERTPVEMEQTKKLREKTPTEMSQTRELIAAEGAARPTDARILAEGGQPAENLIAAQRRIQEPSQILTNLYKAQIAESEVTRQAKEQELLNKPVESLLHRRIQIAQETQFKAYANRANAEAEAIRSGEKYRLKGMKADETLRSVEKLDKLFDDSYKAWTQKTAQLPDIETTAYRTINELGSMVAAHITGMKNYTGSGAMGIRSLMTWAQRVDREFDRPKLEAGWFGGSKAVIDQQNRRKWYVRNAAQFITMMGGIPKGYETIMANYVLEWAKAAGISDNELDQMFGLEQEVR